MLAERLVTIRKIEAWTERHTHFLLDYAGKSKGDNGICHQHSEARTLGFAFIVNVTKFTFSRIYLKMDPEIHGKAIKRSCNFPRYIKCDMSFRLQENFNPWSTEKCLADRSVDSFYSYQYYIHSFNHSSIKQTFTSHLRCVMHYTRVSNS